LHNLDLFTALSDGQAAIPVLKGNAYGHGIAQVAQALKGRTLPYIAVDGYFEGLRVRQITKQPILVMGSILPENYKRLRYRGFTFVVHDTASIHALGRTGRRIKVHLECNTGMNRYGAKPAEVVQLTQLIRRYKNLQLEGVMSHLADGDGNDQATINTAVTQFDACIDAVLAAGAKPTLFHIGNTPGTLRVRSKYANAFRLGIGLYGINPYAPDHKMYRKLKGLRPALKFVTTITKVIQLQKGDKVSYAYTFTAPRNMPLGVVPVGYYEGVNRALSNTGAFRVGADYARVAGRVCMNHTMLSLDGIPAKAGTEVVVYSNVPDDKNTIEAVAAAHKLFSYNLLTALSPDVRRVLVD